MENAAVCVKQWHAAVCVKQWHAAVCFELWFWLTDSKETSAVFELLLTNKMPSKRMP